MTIPTRRDVLRLLAAGLAGALPARAAWPLADGPRDSLRFVFYTDVHARTEWQTPEAMAMAARAINARAPDLVIAGGDLITDGFQSAPATVAPRWDAYLEMQRAIRGRVEPVIGNHDLVAAIPEDGSDPAEDPRSEFRRRLGVERTSRTFDAAGVRFLLLDSIDVVGGELKYEGRIGDAQRAWIRDVLSHTDVDVPLVVGTHLPMLTAFYQATEGTTAAAPANRVVTDARETLELFREHHLALVLQGHLHVDEMLRWQGTTFVTGGAVCGKWWRGSWHGTREGFGVVTLRRDRVDWEYVHYGWTARRP
jgi:3',5'-cyclic AMP phosphodiesterase CpdA